MCPRPIARLAAAILLAPGASAWAAPAIVAIQPQQGSAELDLTIGTEGWPVACKVTRSGGDRRLDAAACRHFLRRPPGAEPPQAVRRDARGKPVRYHLTVGLAPSFLSQLPR